MFNSIVEFLRSAITEQIVDDPGWATIALIGQLVFGARFDSQRVQEKVSCADGFMGYLGCRQPDAVELFYPYKKSSFYVGFFIEYTHIYSEPSFDLQTRREGCSNSYRTS